MYHEKRYLQFNDLVFDGYDMLSSYDETTGYKTSSTAYTYGHGSYAPLKADYLFVSEGSVTMTLTLHTKKLPCEDRPFYVKFAEQELGRPGKLWAIKNGEIIWAYAYVKNRHQIVNHRPWEIEYDIEFGLPEGIWHKADKQKTFVLPYNVCTFMECKGYKVINPCDADGNCCIRCGEPKQEDRCFCCCVDEITKDMALCYHLKELQNFYGCDTPFQIVYDCLHAEKFFGTLGTRMCVDDICDDSVIAGRFYSETDIPTTAVTIIIDGKMHNPWVTINGNTNIIEGDYEGELIITPSGDVYYRHGGCDELLDPSVWVIPANMDYGWTVYPLNNSISVNLNRCCTGATCIYIQDDPITT